MIKYEDVKENNYVYCFDDSGVGLVRISLVNKYGFRIVSLDDGKINPNTFSFDETSLSKFKLYDKEDAKKYLKKQINSLTLKIKLLEQELNEDQKSLNNLLGEEVKLNRNSN